MRNERSLLLMLAEVVSQGLHWLAEYRDRHRRHDWRPIVVDGETVLAHQFGWRDYPGEWTFVATIAPTPTGGTVRILSTNPPQMIELMREQPGRVAAFVRDALADRYPFDPIDYDFSTTKIVWLMKWGEKL